MRIAVNTRMLIPGKMEGIGVFTHETMQRITRRHREHEFYFIFDRKFDPSFIYSDNITPVVVSPPARHPLLWYIWYEWSLPSTFKKINPDVFIGTDGFLSLTSRVHTIAVFHDINFEHYPKDLPFFNRIFYRNYFKRYAENAVRIAAVSGFTKNDIVNTYRISPEKIDVVYNGVSEHFKPLNKDVAEETRKKFTGGHPYFLFVGALHSRKNIANLLRAFDTFKKNNSNNMKLVLTGQKRWWTVEMENAFKEMEFGSDVIFTGRVNEIDLLNITASAFALTYVSNFEGFGIPILEAMKCNVPVITSNVSSMPEIAGDAALLCNPASVHSIADAMTKIYSDENLRRALIEKGKIRQQNFSWDKTSEELWETIMRSVAG